MSALITTHPIEHWAHVPGFPGYEVSSLGRIQSTFIRSVGSPRPKTRVLSIKPNKLSGRVLVSLRAPDGTYPKMSMQRLVLLAFVGPCPNGMEACHNNGIRDDNRLSNLRWDTHLGNIADKALHGTNLTGERHGAAKLTAAKVELALDLLSQGLSQRETAARLGVSRGAIGAFVIGRNWPSVVRGRRVHLSDEMRIARDRRCQVVGSARFNAKLTDQKVALMRFLRVVHGALFRDLADWFGVTADAARSACSGGGWKHVPPQEVA